MMANQYNTRVRVPNSTDSREGVDSTESHDGLSPNLNRRDKLDDGIFNGKRGKSFLSCKNSVTVSTMNVRTIREQSRREELVSNLATYNVEILGIQEHRILHDEPVRYETILSKTLITTSATRNSAGAAVGGVGILLNTHAKDSLASVRPHTDRILIVNLQGNPATTIIVTYCPTNVVDEAIIEKHYDNLRRAIDSIPAHNLLMVVGDFNARIGPEDAKFTFHEATNRNGKYLMDLVIEKNLINACTMFQKRMGKLWTYISPGGSKYQLDYILVRKKWKNSLLNAEAYNTFASVGSDHRIVSAKIRLSLRKSRTMSRKKLFDWKALADKDLREHYNIEVRNRYQPLVDMEESATQKYEKFIIANREAAEIVIPVKKRSCRARYSSDVRVTGAREEIKVAYRTYEQDTNERNRLQYKQAKKNLEEAYNLVIEEDLSNKILGVETAHTNCKHGESWKLINEITGRRASTKGQLEGDNQQERVANWYNHFQDLLGSPPDINDEDEDIPQILDELNIKVGPFDQSEYVKAKESLVEGKSCGEDGIPPEVLKRCDFDDIILEFCNRALLDGEKPEQWSILNIIPIPKSGDLSKGGNYRGISLSSIVAKTFNRMILNRIRPELDKHMRCNQNGFRVGRTTTGHILALRRLIEGVKAKNLPAIITFIDFKKAFDTIHRGKMMKILRAYGIPTQIVKAIGTMYEDTKAKVISPDGETKLFDILAGVLQGDTLAPYLFVIVLDYALKVAIDGKEEKLGFQLVRRQSRRIGPEVVTDLDFADDIALLSEQVHQAQELLSLVEASVAKVGLKMNAGKTKFMSFNQKQEITLRTNDGTELEEVKDFKYLGAWMESTEKDVKVRKAAAWKALNKLAKIWKSTLPKPLKLRVFNATVESVLLYGCEAWTVSPKLAKELDGCYTRMLRTAYNIHWKQYISNQELYGDLPRVSQKIRERRCRFAGHCFRSADEPVSRLLHWNPTHGKRRQGRPSLTYVDVLTQDTGLEASDIKIAMTDRKLWKAMVVRGHHST